MTDSGLQDYIDDQQGAGQSYIDQLNSRQSWAIERYNGLMDLVEHSNDVFTYSDYMVNGYKLRIFTYMMASYSDWLHPFAPVSRGTAFMLYPNDEMMYQASHTMPKFFNIYENPFTEYSPDTTVSAIDEIMDKEDGSLISTFTDVQGDLRVKSHGSTESPHAKVSHRLIIGDAEFQQALMQMEEAGYTVNMEFVSNYTDFRIVLEYTETKLIVLNIINRETGEYLPREQYPEVLRRRAVKSYSVEEYLAQYTTHAYNPDMLLSEFVDIIRELSNMEGVVMKMKPVGDLPAQYVKCKTEWYCNLHACCTGFLYEKPLCMAILNGNLDDILPYLQSDNVREHALNRQREVYDFINKLVHDTAELCDPILHLEPKEFGFAVKQSGYDRIVKSQAFGYRMGGKEYTRDALVTWFKKRSGWKYLKDALHLNIEDAIDITYREQVATQEYGV